MAQQVKYGNEHRISGSPPDKGVQRHKLSLSRHAISSGQVMDGTVVSDKAARTVVVPTGNSLQIYPKI